MPSSSHRPARGVLGPAQGRPLRGRARVPELRFGGGTGGGDLGDPLVHDGRVGPSLQGGPASVAAGSRPGPVGRHMAHPEPDRSGARDGAGCPRHVLPLPSRSRQYGRNQQRPSTRQASTSSCECWSSAGRGSHRGHVHATAVEEGLSHKRWRSQGVTATRLQACHSAGLASELLSRC